MLDHIFRSAILLKIYYFYGLIFPTERTCISKLYFFYQHLPCIYSNYRYLKKYLKIVTSSVCDKLRINWNVLFNIFHQWRNWRTVRMQADIALLYEMKIAFNCELFVLFIRAFAENYINYKIVRRRNLDNIRWSFRLRLDLIYHIAFQDLLNLITRRP